MYVANWSISQLHIPVGTLHLLILVSLSHNKHPVAFPICIHNIYRPKKSKAVIQTRFRKRKKKFDGSAMPFEIACSGIRNLMTSNGTYYVTYALAVVNLKSPTTFFFFLMLLLSFAQLKPDVPDPRETSLSTEHIIGIKLWHEKRHKSKT